MNKGNNIKKCKALSFPLFDVNDFTLTHYVHITYYSNNDIEHIYISTFLRYKSSYICPDKKFNKNDKKCILYNKSEDYKNEEDIIRKVMNENKGIGSKELIKITGINMFTVYRIYMKIRREMFK